MNDYTTLIDLVQTAPVIAVFYFLWKSGAINIGNGKKNGVQAQIDELKKHAETSNREVGQINKKMGVMAEDISFIRGLLNNKHGRD